MVKGSWLIYARGCRQRGDDGGEYCDEELDDSLPLFHIHINLHRPCCLNNSFFCFDKNLKNPSGDVSALRAFVLTSSLCACEQAPGTSPDIIPRCFATETITRGKTPFALLTKKHFLSIFEINFFIILSVATSLFLRRFLSPPGRWFFHDDG